MNVNPLEGGKPGVKKKVMNLKQFVPEPIARMGDEVGALFKTSLALEVMEATKGYEQQWLENLKKLDQERRGRKRLMLVVPDGQSIRTILGSSVWHKLQAEAQIVLVTPFQQIRQLLGELQIPEYGLIQAPQLDKSGLDTLFRFAHYRNSKSPTHQHFVQRLEQARTMGHPEFTGRRQLYWDTSAEFVGREAFFKLYRFSILTFGATYPLRLARDFIVKCAPDLMLNANAINFNSKLWTRASALAGVPVVSNVVSWDNISSKWLIDEFSDTYMVWNQEMKTDFQMTFPYLKGKKRIITGTPQFEPILEKKGLLKKDEFFTRMNLDPSLPLVLYTTGSKTTFPKEPECLHEILTHWKQNWRDRMQFMVRMHPKDRSHRYDELRAAFPQVCFTYAGENLADGEEWIPTQSDIELLVNQLTHASVGVNVASTMTLEGFAVDLPCVNIGFDMGLVNSLHYPLSDYYSSKHYRDVVSSGSVSLVQNFQELYKAIEEAVENRVQKKTARNRMFKLKCQFADSASDRMADVIRRALK